jgi:uncharacterized protein YggE
LSCALLQITTIRAELAATETAKVSDLPLMSGLQSRNSNMRFRTLQLSTAAACAMLASTWAIGAEAERPRTISVTGQAEIQAEPDRALLTLGVEARKLKMEEARAEVTKTVDAVLKLTRDLKIDPKYVRATRISVQPEYNWDNNARERNLIGYYVSRQVEIELRDLEKLGQLLEKSVDLGVNQIGDPRLDSSKRRELEREALAKAVADAKLNAEAVAKAAGARIGPPRTIAASSGFVPPPMPMMKAQLMRTEAAADASQTYQSGQMGFSGSVQVEYDLIPQTP